MVQEEQVARYLREAYMRPIMPKVPWYTRVIEWVKSLNIPDKIAIVAENLYYAAMKLKAFIRRHMPQPDVQTSASRRDPDVLERYAAVLEDRDQKQKLFGVALILCAIVFVLLAVMFILSGGFGPKAEYQVSEADPSVRLTSADISDRMTPAHVTFCAVGDNLANETVLEFADSWAGEMGDGWYDFVPFYREIKPVVSGYDIAFINQETVLAGVTDSIGYMGYPSYNTPDSIADAVVDAGFDVVNFNSNHSYDLWTSGIERSQAVWSQYPEITLIGSYTGPEDRANVRVIESHGIKVAFLSYSQFQNARSQSDLPNDWYAVPFDEDGLIQDYEIARSKADIVVVYLHGGTEYEHWPDEWEQYAAQFCADLGVDLVIGSHVHVIQPVVWLTRSYNGNLMSCAFGLGDFLSGYYDYPDLVLSGLFSCDFTEQKDGSYAVENVVWTPLLEYRTTSYDGSVDGRVRLVKNITVAEASQNEMYRYLDPNADPFLWPYLATQEVMSPWVTLGI